MLGVKYYGHKPRKINMKLYVGFESTWSLRSWICAQISKLEINTHVLPLNGEGYKSNLIDITRTGFVPALDTGEFLISDSLAIAEYLNERSEGALYPNGIKERSIARSLVCELHSGFINLRTSCPFSTGVVNPANRDYKINSELERLDVIFSQAKNEFMFNTPTAVDAFYSILAYRLHAYGIIFSGEAGKYQKSLLNWSLLQRAIDVNIEWGSNARNSREEFTRGHALAKEEYDDTHP